MKPASRNNAGDIAHERIGRGAACHSCTRRCDHGLEREGRRHRGGEADLVRPHGRALAILHLAMFEAVNAIERRYAPYKLNLTADRNTSKEAAAASAGYDVLLSLYPDQKADLDATLAKSLAGIPEGESKAKGIALGKKAAAEIIALRANDGINAPESYRPHTSPGVYVPTVVAISSTVGAVTPWVMTSGSQFRPAPPPALDSETWTRDLNEIRELGARNSTKRTAEQTTIGRFWFLTGARTFNPIVHQVAKAKEHGRCRLRASLRPRLDGRSGRLHRRIRCEICLQFLASGDGDPQCRSNRQQGDAARCIVAAARRHADAPGISLRALHHLGRRAAVLQAVVGRVGRRDHADEPDRARRHPQVDALQDYSDEVSNARIYAGFHYRFSTEVGKDMGKKIGELTVTTQLRRSVAGAQPSR